jgi:type IV pilus assembly protein PilB
LERSNRGVIWPRWLGGGTFAPPSDGHAVDPAAEPVPVSPDGVEHAANGGGNSNGYGNGNGAGHSLEHPAAVSLRPGRPSAPPATPRSPGSVGPANGQPGRPGSMPPGPTDGTGAPPSAAGEGKPALPRIEPIGEILLSHNAITHDQLRQALEVQRQSKGRLGRVLVEMGAVTERQLARAIAQQWGLPYTELAEDSINPGVARFIPAYLSQRHGVIAVDRKQDRLVVAMPDPSNVVAIDDIRLLTGLDVEIIIASPEDVARLQGKFQGLAVDVEELLKAQPAAAESEILDDPSRTEEVTIERLRSMVEEAPVVRVVNQIIHQAVRAGASDIHLEPHRRDVKVRFRVDGLLQDIMAPPKQIQAALISRVKILANLDIAERRVPQDGHIHLRLEGREYDLRVSTLPTVLGEKIVIRLLDQSSTKVSLTRIGMPSDLLGAWEGLITKPYGMIIVTGPTGSGKTTTLYTSLERINTPERNIVSVEDPVEYQIPRINQVQVNIKAGLTFAGGLRSILRQDPDVVLIGEVRDRETAQIAVQAAMTGHLVLTTLHTNDAPGAATRLADMGIEPFLVTGSLIGVLAQRLIRVICTHCKEAYTPPADALRRLGLDPAEHGGLKLYRGRGCDACRTTGYRGRLGVFELMVLNDRLRAQILDGASADLLRAAAQEDGMRLLREDGVQKVLEGVTTVEELLRVVFVTEDK